MTRVSLLLLFIPALSWAATPDHEERRQVMGTLANVAAWADDSSLAVRAVDAAYVAFARVDSLMSTWRDDSALAALNRAPAHTWVEVGPETAAVLAEAKAMAEISDGAFDPTVLPLIKLWGFRGGQKAVPDPDLLAAVLDRVDYTHLEVDLATGRARMGLDGMEADLGGIAKGHALDVAAEAMRAAGVSGGLLDLGGNILVFGEGPEEVVGIRDPHGSGMLAVLPLEDGAVATSGQYERFVVLEGERFGHVLDPRTGRPVPAGLAVTVLAPDALTADALATAGLVLGARRGLAFLDSIPGVEALFVVGEPEKDPSLLATSGLNETP